ncbi:MAG: hypothetical protein EOO07_15050 [Chitinophagaceae bacterium]|nr:MAG: hypothetical protein EOO07_15050 [Chitinophagaceae bacterium]
MRNLLYLLIVVLTCSCNYSANQQTDVQLYTKDGLSFELQKYWEVEKDRAISGVANSRLITVSNNEPFVKDSYFVITAVDRKKSLAFTLENLIEQSRASFAKSDLSY